MKGEAFEYFLADTFRGRGLGEYFTPRNIVEFMVDAIDPKIGDTIVDPFCGTGGFLIYAFDIVSEKIRLQEFSESEKKKWRLQLSDRSLYGTDWKERTSQACKMNMMVHGDGSAGIAKLHGLVDVPGLIEEGSFDICLTNPPFGAHENDPKILANYELGAGRKAQEREALAIERAIRLVKPGGWIAIVVPDGILNNDSKQYVRSYLRRNAWVHAVVSLADETFEGYGAAAKTSVLLVQRKSAPDEGEQRHVFMAIAKNTGYAPNGAAVPGNQLPDILLDYRAFVKGDKAFRSTAWLVENPVDRLDAEFYWQPSDGEAPYRAISVVRSDVAEILAEITSEYKAIEAAMSGGLQEREFVLVAIAGLLEEVAVPVKVLPGESYSLLGVSWWGEGAFIKEPVAGASIKAKTLYVVSSGWVIYSRLFARNGAFAVLGDEHDGCYVSGEFPTFKVREGVKSPQLVAKYIVHCLNSPKAHVEVEAASTGSTKRSRGRLTERNFLAMELQIPKTETSLRLVVDLLDKATALRPQGQRFLDRAKELSASVAATLPRPFVSGRTRRG